MKIIALATEAVAKLQVTTSKRSKGSKSRIISNTMQEPRCTGEEMGLRDIESLDLITNLVSRKAGIQTWDSLPPRVQGISAFQTELPVRPRKGKML